MGDKKSSKPKVTRNQVNVRLTDDEARMIDDIAKENRMSKSDVVRFAIVGELKEVSAKRTKPMTPEQRIEILEAVGKATTLLSKVKADNAKLGNNVNQIARRLNSDVTKLGNPHGKEVGATVAVGEPPAENQPDELDETFKRIEKIQKDVDNMLFLHRMSDTEIREGINNISKELREIWQSLV